MGKPRHSIVTDDMRHCYICQNNITQEHHIFHGTANRRLSEKYDIVVRLCPTCHGQVHAVPNRGLDLALKKIGQAKFNEVYPDLNFREIFGKNYL